MLGLPLGLICCVLSVSLCFWQVRRSLGAGLVTLLAIGYVYASLRYWISDGFSHFIFDVGVIGLYAGHFVSLRHSDQVERSTEGLKIWVALLVLWPIALALAPVNHYLVQLVVLRHLTLFLPLILLGARLQERDLDTLTRALVYLNILAAGYAIAQYFLGVQLFFPRTDDTDLIFSSRDVSSGEDEGLMLRIPGAFLNSHLHGATMMCSLPWLLSAYLRARPESTFRLLSMLSMALSTLCIFLCGARSPVVSLALTIIGFLLWPTLSMRMRVAAVSVVAVGSFIAFQVFGDIDRLQRFTSLGDTELVSQRIDVSLQNSLLDLIVEYPLGAGLGSAFGSSIPGFLRDVAPQEQIFNENEYARIIVEQGVLGLVLWICFLGKFFLAPLVPISRDWQLPFLAMKVQVLVTWSIAFLGTGTLQAIPSSLLLLLTMGLLMRDIYQAPRFTSVVPSPRRASMT